MFVVATIVYIDIILVSRTRSKFNIQ